MEFVATTNELFFGGKFVNGLAVGTLQTTAGSYIGEVCSNQVSNQHGEESGRLG
jgi:fucose permease